MGQNTMSTYVECCRIYNWYQSNLRKQYYCKSLNLSIFGFPGLEIAFRGIIYITLISIKHSECELTKTQLICAYIPFYYYRYYIFFWRKREYKISFVADTLLVIPVRSNNKYKECFLFHFL
jgi:hypothetical protein